LRSSKKQGFKVSEFQGFKSPFEPPVSMAIEGQTVKQSKVSEFQGFNVSKKERRPEVGSLRY
jgi:hypothetical protein